MSQKINKVPSFKSLKNADYGFRGAQYEVGIRYKNGIEVEQDFYKAFEYLEKAARQNHWKAQYEIANMYYHGIGIKKDLDKALDYYKKSAEGGHSQAYKAYTEYKKLEKEKLENKEKVKLEIARKTQTEMEGIFGDLYKLSKQYIDIEEVDDLITNKFIDYENKLEKLSHRIYSLEEENKKLNQKINSLQENNYFPKMPKYKIGHKFDILSSCKLTIKDICLMNTRNKYYPENSIQYHYLIMIKYLNNETCEAWFTEKHLEEFYIPYLLLDFPDLETR